MSLGKPHRKYALVSGNCQLFRARFCAFIQIMQAPVQCRFWESRERDMEMSLVAFGELRSVYLRARKAIASMM